MRNLSLYISIILMLCVSNLQAQTVDSLFSLAKENNPMLKEKALQVDMLAEKKAIVSVLPDPNISAMIMLRPMETSFGDQRFVFTASQMMPWFGSLKLAANAESAKAKSAYYDYLDAAARLYSELQMSYVTITAELALIENLEENRQLTQRLTNITESRIKGGAGSAAMLLQMQMNLEEMETEISNKKVRIQQMKRSLLLLIGLSVDDSISIDTHLNMPEWVEKSVINTENFGLQSIQYLQTANEEEQALAKKRGMPNLEFGMQYDPRFMNQSGPIDALMPMIGMSLPIYRKKYKSMQKEKELEAEMLENSLRNRSLQLQNEWEKAQYQLIESKNKAELYAKNKERTQRILDLEIRKYASDGDNYDEIIRLQALLISLTKSEILAKLQANNAVIRLEYLTNK